MTPATVEAERAIVRSRCGLPGDEPDFPLSRRRPPTWEEVLALATIELTAALRAHLANNDEKEAA